MLPLPVLVVVVVGLSMTGALALVFLARASRGRHKMEGTSDIEASYITVVGTIYAILIAFMVFAVWARFEAAQEDVDQEAGALMDIYRLADALPEPERTRLREACMDYVRVVVNREWPAMAARSETPPSRRVVSRMWAVLMGLGPTSMPDSLLRDKLLDRFTRLTDLRGMRLLRARTGLPSILYAALFVGGAITLAMAALFTVRDFWPHALKAVSLAAMISLLLLIVWTLDHPFQGRVHVEPTALERTLRIVQEDQQ